MLMYVSTEKQDRPIIFKMNSNGVKSLKKLSTDTTRNTIHIIVETIFFLIHNYLPLFLTNPTYQSRAIFNIM